MANNPEDDRYVKGDIIEILQKEIADLRRRNIELSNALLRIIKIPEELKDKGILTEEQSEKGKRALGFKE